MTTALAPLTVIDVSESVAGQYCARLLADYGADVWLGEAPGGSPMRRQAPMSTIDAESLLFRHLNAGKWSTLVQTETRLDDIASLAGKADVVIVGDAHEARVATKANPLAIIALVTGFGEDSALVGWRGSEMIYQALSGTMVNNGRAGRPPLYGTGDRASFSAGLASYIGIMAALLERERSGKGQLVDVAVAEIAAAMSTAAISYNYSGKIGSGRAQKDSLARCKDGFVLIWVYPYQWRDFCTALDAPHLHDDPRFFSANDREANWAALMNAVQDVVADIPADDLVARLRQHRLITAKAASLTDLLDDPHLAARQYWTQSEDGRTTLGAPFRLSKTPRRRPGGPPVIPTSAMLPLARPAPVSRSVGKAAPLAGIRILEFTTAWAGPMAGRILAFLGAEVIHVEHASRPDLWRHHRQAFRPGLYPGGEGGERPHNRNSLFNSQNINKLSLSLDIKSPRGLDLARGIARQCDVVFSSFTPGMLARAGLGYDAIKTNNPEVIFAEMPAFGSSGPWAQAPAVGITMEMASGMAGLIGYADGPPTGTGPNYLDPIGGLNAAAAILTALRHRQISGEGQYVEIPQVEAAMQFIGAELLLAMETRSNPARRGNTLPCAALHDVFPARGEDQWVAIAAPDEAALRGLATVVPNFDPARAFTTVADWVCSQDKHIAAERLQAVGVPAAPVLDGAEVATSAHLRQRSFFSRLAHAEAGKHDYPTIPIRLGRTPGGDRRAAPCLGADTGTILRDVLKLDRDEIAALERDGVIAADPV